MKHLTHRERLRMKAIETEGAYLDLINSLPDAYHRSREQQREVDAALSAKLAATYAVIHHV